MENATNSTFKDLLKEYVTDPLEIEHTVLDYSENTDLNDSGFFIKRGKKGVSYARKVYLAIKAQSGGLLSASENLVKFGNAYLYGRILSDESRVEMHTDIPLSNGTKTVDGHAWSIITNRQGRIAWSHTG